jgi:hypothetical protein
VAVQTFIDRIAKARKKYEDEKKKAGKSARKEIAKYLADVLPEGFILEWSQYTPSFNDGDPCTFRLSSCYIATYSEPVDSKEYVSETAVNAEAADGVATPPEEPEGEGMEVIPEPDDDLASERDELSNYDGEFGCEDLEYGDENALVDCGLTKTQFKKVKSAWKKVADKELLEEVFGDPARIRVYWDGRITVEETEAPY